MPACGTHSSKSEIATSRRLPARDLPYNPLSTARRQPGILMHVHPVLLGIWSFSNLSFLGQNRMDNLLKAHS